MNEYKHDKNKAVHLILMLKLLVKFDVKKNIFMALFRLFLNVPVDTGLTVAYT